MNVHSTISRSERASLQRKSRRQRIRRAAFSFLITLIFIAAAVIVWGWWERTGGFGDSPHPAPGEEQPASLSHDADASENVEGSSADGADREGGAVDGAGSEATDAAARSETSGAGGQQTTSTDGDDPATGADRGEPNERVRLTFVGDVLLGSTVDTNLLQKHGYDYPYWHIRDLLREADILAANLETPITERGEPEDKQYVYRSRPQALPAFRDAGFDIVGLANNHILDYGLVGLEDTLHHLQQNGILHVGAGMDIDEAFRAEMIEIKGMRIAYLAFSQVVPHVDWKATPYQGGVADTYALERPLAEIASAKEKADIVVVLVHWGQEREHEPNERQIETAKSYIDAGADLVVGSHPHVLQSVQSYNGKWIAYSLGNFIFTTNDYAPTWESAVMNAYCDKSGDCELELVPVSVKWAQPVPMDREQSREVFDRLEQWSPGVKIDRDGKVSWVQ